MNNFFGKILVMSLLLSVSLGIFLVHELDKERGQKRRALLYTNKLLKENKELRKRNSTTYNKWLEERQKVWDLERSLRRYEISDKNRD